MELECGKKQYTVGTVVFPCLVWPLSAVFYWLVLKSVAYFGFVYGDPPQCKPAETAATCDGAEISVTLHCAGSFGGK